MTQINDLKITLCIIAEILQVLDNDSVYFYQEENDLLPSD